MVHTASCPPLRILKSRCLRFGTFHQVAHVFSGLRNTDLQKRERFRARQRFFRVEISTVHDDLEYLRQRFLVNEPVSELTVSDHTRKHHVALILEHFRYRLCGQEERLELEQRAMFAARISTRPVFVLRELADFMRLNRIVLPGYTYLQDVVRRALAFERHRLSDALIELIAVDVTQLLDRLLEDDDGVCMPSHRLNTNRVISATSNFWQRLSAVTRSKICLKSPKGPLL